MYGYVYRTILVAIVIVAILLYAAFRLIGTEENAGQLTSGTHDPGTHQIGSAPMAAHDISANGPPPAPITNTPVTNTPPPAAYQQPQAAQGWYEEAEINPQNGVPNHVIGDAEPVPQAVQSYSPPPSQFGSDMGSTNDPEPMGFEEDMGGWGQ